MNTPQASICPPFGLFLACLGIAAPGFAAEAKTPNVVIFLADAAGWDDYGINGNRLNL